MLSVGDKAPQFSLNDGEGNQVKLSSLKGKKVVLYFYPKDLTPGCTVEACAFRDDVGALKKLGAVVLGTYISVIRLLLNEPGGSSFIEPFR